DFVPLFDGKSLDGWTQRGGKALYAIKDGAILGTAVPGTPNSFLCTDRDYGDFVLEYEFLVHPKLNSGVQIRSHSLQAYRNGRVHGYQVEIDPDVDRNRMWTAGIYEEARRGWLNDLAANEPARKAFKPEQWNAVRVRAVGDSIKTWLNGVPAADLVDSMTLSGFIGLQVHSIGKKTGGPFTVSWRNLRIKDLGKHEWKPIFNGKDLSGWDALPGGQWSVKEGAIVGVSQRAERRHGILLSKESYKDFTVRCKLRVHSGDSGFYFRAKRVRGGVAVHGFQAEVDETGETGGLYETGGRAWVVKPDTKVAKSAKHKKGEWSELTVSAHGRRIVVHLNGVKTAELIKDKGRLEGHFGLQLHGGQDMHVEYKDIEMLLPAKAVLYPEFPDYKPKTGPDTLFEYRPRLGFNLPDLPKANLKELGALLKSLSGYQKKAAATPGKWVRGNIPLGADEREYEPSDSELLVSEIGSRIQKVLDGSSPDEVAKALASGNWKKKVVEFNVIGFRHVDVLGSGRFFYASEPRSVRLRLR
ncbi:MAG: DUF1080 domain-containing protein, partial [Planctomycetota bacterium]|nr:DUF1080 domain-containing protein [Planctomycetota bacterium]